MDIFYKPPMQRHDECTSLERNYMNCMMQKALKDKVMHNRCRLENILWFHLECPKYAEKFDHPGIFKKKFKDYFEESITKDLIHHYSTPSSQRFQKEFNHFLYPEDVKARKQFDEKFEEEYNPYKHIHEEYEELADDPYYKTAADSAEDA